MTYLLESDPVYIMHHPSHCGYTSWPPVIADDGTVYVELYDDHDCAIGGEELHHGPLPR